MPRSSRTVCTSLLALLLLLCPGTGTASAEAAEAAELRDLLDRYAAAVVPVEAVVRTEMNMGGQGQDDESEIDILGAVVDPGGLIMIWNSRIASDRMSEMMRLMGRDDGNFDFSMTPLSFEVRLPGTEEPVQAFLAAADPQLDLAFLQLVEAPPEPLAYFDLAQGVEGDLVGEEIYAVNRLSVQFTSAAFLGMGRVVGELTKPRQAWIVGGDLQSFGLPIVTADGRVAGVLSTVVSSVEVERAASQMGGMANAMGAGDGKTMGPIGAFALPVAVVARAMERSRERARSMQESGASAGESGGSSESSADEQLPSEDEASSTEEAPEEGGPGEGGGAETDSQD